MNLSARESGNWTWRYTAGALTPAVRERLRLLTETYGRGAPKPAPAAPAAAGDARDAGRSVDAPGRSG